MYKDIILGYTKDYSSGFYIKHFREIDVGFLNEIREEYKSEAMSKGLPTRDEKIKMIIEQGLWEDEKEQEIKLLKDQLANQYQTKSKLIIQGQIRQVQKRIDKLEEQIYNLEKEKEELLGLTAEQYSDKISSEQVMRLSFFKDDKLSEESFSEEEYDYLEPEELSGLVDIYGKYSSALGTENIKRIAASSFFMNSLFLCKDDATRFFGKSIVELTNNQTELFSTGLMFKSVLEKGNNPPSTMQNDIDKLVDWYENAGNLSESGTKNQDKSGSTVMGATNKELDSISGGGPNVIDLEKEVEKRGGTLEMKDFIDLHSD